MPGIDSRFNQAGDGEASVAVVSNSSDKVAVYAKPGQRGSSIGGRTSAEESRLRIGVSCATSRSRQEDFEVDVGITDDYDGHNGIGSRAAATNRFTRLRSLQNPPPGSGRLVYVNESTAQG